MGSLILILLLTKLLTGVVNFNGVVDLVVNVGSLILMVLLTKLLTWDFSLLMESFTRDCHYKLHG